jgi:hypothetical protein
MAALPSTSGPPPSVSAIGRDNGAEARKRLHSEKFGDRLDIFPRREFREVAGMQWSVG